jgi:hypothetical protein
MEEDDDSIYHPTPSTSSSPEPISDGDVDINLREEERTLEVETDMMRRTQFHSSITQAPGMKMEILSLKEILRFP